jgi:hypothetical protein
MIEIMAMVLVPCFALSGFMIGCLMSKGEIWPTRALSEEIRKLNKREQLATDRYEHLQRRFEHQAKLLGQYQEAYPPLPSEFQTIIQEEPDVLSLS